MASRSTSSTSQITSSSIIGGDYAGLSATFSHKTGALIPVPDHLVPHAMLEWGDVPSHMETLTSETQCDDGFERTIVTVLPEVGCGIDNLETVKKVQVYNVEDTNLQVHGFRKEQVVIIDRRTSTQQFDIETIIQTADEIVENNVETKIYPRRIRLSFSIDLTTSSLISSDISLQVERQWSPQSTSGAMWTGEASNSGGLDARSVMNHIGKDIVYGDVFAVKKEKQGGDRWDVVSDASDVFDGRWFQTVLDGGSKKKTEVHRCKGKFGLDSTENSGITTIRLPQNVLVRYGTGLGLPDKSEMKKRGIEVSHFKELNGKLERTVVLRLLGDEKDDLVQSIATLCWTEDKI